ncbi:MAG: SDR family NAD(P)-dependent oxidoreductase [Candidatus Sumerlaeia bacterium]
MQWAVITGADRGIGYEFARQYLADGWTLWASSLDPEKATALHDLRAEYPDRLEIFPLDLRDDASIQACAEKARTMGRGLDILVNNAGGLVHGESGIDKLDSDKMLELYRVNVVGPLLLTRALAPVLAESPKPRVAFLCSRIGTIHSHRTPRGYSYGMTKAALHRAIPAVAADLAGRGISVVGLDPGWVLTPITDVDPRDRYHISPEKSVGGMRRVLSHIQADESGRFFRWDGRPCRWYAAPETPSEIQKKGTEKITDEKNIDNATALASRRWCFSTLGCTDLNLEQVLELAKRFGIQEIELRALEENLNLPQYLEEKFGDPAKVRERFEKAEVRLTVLDTSFRLAGCDDEQRENFLAFVPWAEALGVPWLRVFDGGKYLSEIDPQYIQEAAATVEWWRGERAKNGWDCDMVIETHDSLLSSDALEKFQQALDEPAAILWDAHHPWFKGGEKNIGETWSRIRPWVKHVHFKDSIPEPAGNHPYTYQLLGEGEFPLGELIALLDRDGYGGAISLEWERKWHPYLPPLEEALESLANFVARHDG